MFEILPLSQIKQTLSAYIQPDERYNVRIAILGANMNESATPSRVDAIKEVAISMTKDSWQSYGRALLLARLGQALTRMGFDLKSELKGEKLAAFIDRELNKKHVTLLSLPSDPLVMGIVPFDAILQEDKSVYFSRPDSTSPQRTSERVNFDRNIWLAFSRAIPPGCVRAISLKPIVQVLDIPGGTDVTDQYLVPAELVVSNVSLPKYERAENISKNILQWATSNKIGLDQIKASFRDVEFGERNNGSVLSMLLRSLDESDLRRISLPLDIVEKLQNKQAKSNQ